MTTLLSQNNARGSGEPTVRSAFLTLISSVRTHYSALGLFYRNRRDVSLVVISTRSGQLPLLHGKAETTRPSPILALMMNEVTGGMPILFYTLPTVASTTVLDALSLSRKKPGKSIQVRVVIEYIQNRALSLIIVAVDAEPTLQGSRSAASSGVSAALLTLAKHCPNQLGWKTRSKRRYGALEAEDPPKTSRRHRQLIGLGRPRQEEVMFTWLTHPLAPPDVHGDSTEVVQNPCDSEVATAQQESSSHISIKRRKTAHRVSLTSIPEVDEGWSAWLTRPLRTPGTFETSSTPETTSRCTSLTSHLSHRLTTSATVAPVSSAYASCFASPHRPPSVIHWKFP